jgi:hypothetical protein
MKKIISISLTCLMLIALLHFSVATHYCMGKIAASKISLSGKLATCGMEDNNSDLRGSAGFHFSSHCCDNSVTNYGIISIFFPSFSNVPESYNHNFQVFNVPVNLTICSVTSFKTINRSQNPPGESMTNNVDLSYICVFRI